MDSIIINGAMESLKNKVAFERNWNDFKIKNASCEIFNNRVFVDIDVYYNWNLNGWIKDVNRTIHGCLTEDEGWKFTM